MSGDGRYVDWRHHAACQRHQPLFWACEDNRQVSDRERGAAKRICHTCPVLRDCEEYVLTSPHAVLGVAAGMTEWERRRARNQLGTATSRFSPPRAPNPGTAPCDRCQQPRPRALGRRYCDTCRRHLDREKQIRDTARRQQKRRLKEKQT